MSATFSAESFVFLFVV